MREILFRGKTKITNDWVFGDLFQHGEQRFIMADNRNTEVIPETVGSYTGFTDETGKKIFEGDICEVDAEDELLKVSWEDDEAMFVLKGSTFVLDFNSVCPYEIESIGNIHDSPELLIATGEDEGSVKDDKNENTEPV